MYVSAPPIGERWWLPMTMSTATSGPADVHRHGHRAADPEVPVDVHVEAPRRPRPPLPPRRGFDPLGLHGHEARGDPVVVAEAGELAPERLERSGPEVARAAGRQELG